MKNTKQIGYIGHIDHGKTTAINLAIEDAKERGINIIVVGDSSVGKSHTEYNDLLHFYNEEHNDLIIEINGTRYAPIEKDNSKKVSRKGSMFLGVVAGMGIDLNGTIDSQFRQLPKGIDIVKEYGLIQLKKSRLSRWERDAIAHRFERNYKRID